jgi:hypothetical protein
VKLRTIADKETVSRANNNKTPQAATNDPQGEHGQWASNRMAGFGQDNGATMWGGRDGARAGFYRL